jgi:arsenical pump membrane protein
VTSADLVALAERLLPVAVFLVAVTVVAELAQRAGVFEVAGHGVARLGRHRAWLLWLLFAALAVGSTVVLSLDTTAVLLTPVGLAVALQEGLDTRLFAVTTLWVANTGSLLLPVSNLTNLLALHRLSGAGDGHAAYLRLSWAPALVAVVVTLALVAVLHRRSLTARYAVVPPGEVHDPLLLRVAGGVCLALVPLFTLGASPWLVATTAALLLLAVTAWRDRSMLRGLQVPWLMATAFVLVAVAVEVAHRQGLAALVTDQLPTGASPASLVAMSGAGAVLANLVDNLPAYLALEPAAGTSGPRLMALLVGTNAGPLVTPWASLATLLWAQRCRAMGVDVPWRWVLTAGLLCALLVVPLATLALGAAA